MKILMVIDTLASGGAQRYKLQLALGLVERGHKVEIFIYDSNYQFFKSDFEDAGIKIHFVEREGKGFSFQVIKELRFLMKEGSYDTVISTLHSPSIYSAFSVLGIKNCKLIICEVSSSNAPVSFIKKYLFFLSTLIADSVVANSFNEAKLMKKLPGRAKKIHVIWNGFELNSIPFGLNSTHEKKGIRKLLVVGRVAYPKNGVNLLKALSLFLSRNGWLPEVSWVGRRDTDQRSGKDKRSIRIQEQMDLYLLHNKSIEEKWTWLGNVEDVLQYYQTSDALLSVSIYEGMPLVVCEAMLSGCFVIASDVCDHPLIIGKEERGLLCDPLSPESICNAIERLNSMDIDKRIKVISKARQFAEVRFNRDTLIDKFELLLAKTKKS